MLAARASGFVEAGRDRRRRIRFQASLRSRETAASTKSSGEIRARGRPLRMRQKAAKVLPVTASATLVELRPEMDRPAQLQPPRLAHHLKLGLQVLYLLVQSFCPERTFHNGRFGGVKAPQCIAQLGDQTLLDLMSPFQALAVFFFQLLDVEVVTCGHFRTGQLLFL